MSEPSNGSGCQTLERVSVLLALSSPLANLSKARASEGWSSDIMTEILGASSIPVIGSPSVSTGALPARPEFWVWRGGMMIQCISSNILLSVRIKLKGGNVKEVTNSKGFLQC